VKKNKLFYFLLVLVLALMSLLFYLLFFYPQKTLLKATVPYYSLEELAVNKGKSAAFAADNLYLSAQSAYVVDLQDMSVLYEKNADEVFYPASTTKMMTALVADELYGASDTSILFSDKDTPEYNLALYGFDLPTQDLFAALLMISANDVAYNFADNELISYDDFIERMNQKTIDLHLNNSHFINPAGFDDLGQISSARDLSLLAKEFLKNEYFKELVATKEKTIYFSNQENQALEYQLINTNQLLGEIKGIKGVKTGTTELAGEVLVALIERDRHQVLFTLMKSENRYQDAKNVVAWVFNNYSWENLAFTTQ
jgi:D-alanyl-D-alanine carboxypeptidase (penicillin-binding protein 5/6)